MNHSGRCPSANALGQQGGSETGSFAASSPGLARGIWSSTCPRHETAGRWQAGAGEGSSLDTQIVLVRPENPANIGQTARALKNFGLRNLALVNSVPHRVQEAYTLGWNAREIIDQAKTFSSIEEAVRDSVLVIGFTRRSGHARGEPRSFLEILPQVMQTAATHPVSLLFGNERNGLSNQELKHCHLAAVLPTSSGHASLNLSHAVAIAAFLIFNQTPESEIQFRRPERYYATQGELEVLLEDFRRLLKILDYKDRPLNNLLTRTLNHLSRLFKKAGLERREFHLLKALLSKIEPRISVEQRTN